MTRVVYPYDGAAHFGGDELVVILKHLSHPDDAEAVATNILSACNRPSHWREAMVQVGASIGIATFDMRALAQSVVFGATDEVLCETKSCGKGLFTNADELPAGRFRSATWHVETGMLDADPAVLCR